MNTVKIKSIDINNFKGIAKYYIEFNDDITKIYASNGEGKSTIKNAWEWCLCQQVDDYIPNINNKEVTDLVTSVEIKLSVNDIEYVLRRESKGKYITNTETGEKLKSSNENTYQLDGMEVQQKQYQQQIASIIGDGAFENLIILTDKEFFNSDTTKWKWSDRRKLLFKMCNVDNAIEDIISKEEYADIKPYIDKGYATSDIKSMFRKDKESLKKDQEKNLILIEQKQAEINEYLGIDFDKVSQNLTTTKTKLTKLNNSTKRENQTEISIALQEDILNLTQQLNKLKTEDALKLNKLNNEKIELYTRANNLKTEYEKLSVDYKTTEQELVDMQEHGVTTICPMCNQPLNEELQKRANDKFAKRREEKEALLSSLQLEINNTRLNYNAVLEEFNKKSQEIKDFKESEQIKVIEDRVLDLKQQLESTKKANLNKLSEENKKELEEQISSLEQELAKKEFIIKGNKQVALWKDENKEIADKIISVENKERQLQRFVKEQTNIISETVNNKFSNGISWSLYTTNYNGTLEEDCICLYNRKRYSSLSTGERNIANLEVLKSIQEYFDVNIVIFSDNSEANTIEYNTDRQIIELHAKKNERLKGAVKITDLY